jgi:hypothetical protein
MPQDASHDLALQVILAEFSALRDEIKDRAATAYTLLSINITVTVAAAGFVLSDKADPRLLLLLPLTAPALGMLFLDHALNINNIGGYINNNLRPLAVAAARGAATESSKLLSFEMYVREYEKLRLRRILHGFPLILLFEGFPLAALIFCAKRLQHGWEWILWAVGLAMVVTYLILWMLFLVHPRQEANK